MLVLASAAGDASQRVGAGALREGLRDLGWREGETIRLEDRYADGRLERLAPLAAELVSRKVDVIVGFGTLAARAAKEATSTIPIVMGGVGDPIGSGLVTSLARPDGNVTGVSLMVAELHPKRLELLREVLPRVTRIGLIWVSDPRGAPWFPEVESSAARLGVKLYPMGVGRRPDEVARVLQDLARSQVQAVVVAPNPAVDEMRAEIARQAIGHRLPTIAAWRHYVDAGVLMSYGSDLGALHRRSAFYVDRLLKGARPADLPVEQPTKFQLVINLKTAKALGVTIPQSLLLRADEVVQ